LKKILSPHCRSIFYKALRKRANGKGSGNITDLSTLFIFNHSAPKILIPPPPHFFNDPKCAAMAHRIVVLRTKLCGIAGFSAE
jgi:hypothetical protein